MTPSVPPRLLVDECVPRPLVRAMAALNPQTVQQLGWTGMKNGRLLARAAEKFDVLFTVDRDFAGLSDTADHPIGVVIIQVGSTDFERLLPHLDAVSVAIAEVRPGSVRRIGG